MSAPRQRVAITGSSGLIGGALSRSLRQSGHDVVRLVRRAPSTPDEIQWSPDAGRLDPDALTEVDTVVHLAGAGVGDHRWTQEYKAQIHASRVDGTDLIARVIAEGAGPTRLVTASGISVYGDRGDEVLTEHSTQDSTFLADVVRDWEGATAPAKEAGIPVAHARTGIVLSTTGGALVPMVRATRLGAGGPLGSGRQWMPWITLADTVAAYTRLVEDHSLTGPVNLTAPNPVRQRDLARALGRRLHRPAIVPAPRLALRLVLGEFSHEALASVRALPHVLTQAGFQHAHPRLDDALDWLFPTS